MDTLTLDDLQRLYPPARERALKKQLDHLHLHAQRFIALSPYAVLSSAGADGALDASPRGGAPGFAKVLDAHTLLIPDAPGNNRLDTLRNVAVTGRLGLLFMVPGVDETLRINGSAVLSTRADWLDRCSDERRRPPLVIAVTVQEAYLHCAKALMRSKLWSAQSLQPRSCLPSMGEMLRDQIGGDAPAESDEAMRARYAADL